MADAVINGKIQPKRTKAMDMRFHWLRDRECQQQFRIYWRPGKMNYANYLTKHHPESHHRNIRKEFLTPTIVIEMLRIEQQLQQKVARAAWKRFSTIVHRYAYRYASSRCVPIRIFENAIKEAAYRYASLRCVPIRIFETPLTKLKMLLITHRCH